MIADPSAEEILAAIGEWLDRVATGHADRQAYFARVASNALHILRREAVLGPSAAQEERAGLKQLMGREGSLADLNAALCRAIREGRIDETSAELLSHLKRTILRQIEIDQPRYRSLSPR
jgi:hypothetical protein